MPSKEPSKVVSKVQSPSNAERPKTKEYKTIILLEPDEQGIDLVSDCQEEIKKPTKSKGAIWTVADEAVLKEAEVKGPVPAKEPVSTWHAKEPVQQKKPTQVPDLQPLDPASPKSL